MGGGGGAEWLGGCSDYSCRTAHPLKIHGQKFEIVSRDLFAKLRPFSNVEHRNAFLDSFDLFQQDERLPDLQS